MKSKSGNISILVIFILLASSLLGVLSMNFVQQMMKGSVLIHSYYKAYYLAKAWIELWLTEIQYRGIGFEYTVNTWDAIVLDNFLPNQTLRLSSHISGTAILLSKEFRHDTTCQFPYMLNSWQSLIVPLIREEYLWLVSGAFQPGIVYKNLADLFANDKIRFVSSSPWEITFWMLILSGGNLASNGIFFKTWSLTQLPSIFRQQFETYLTTIDPVLYPLESQLKNRYRTSWLIENNFSMYFMVSNSGDTPQSFCVSVDQPIPPIPWHPDILSTDSFFLQSQALYGDQKVALDASYAQPIPGFLFNTYDSY